MKLETLFLPTMALIIMFFGLPKNIQNKVDKEIMEVYEVTNFDFSAKIIDSEVAKTLPSSFGKDNFFEIKVDRKLLGYAYVSKAPSKTDEFDYLVLLDKNLTVLKAKVLIYREDYGGEIGSKRWLKQFIGKTQNDQLKYQEDIVAISGATISVRSITSAMDNLMQSLKILHNKNIL